MYRLARIWLSVLRRSWRGILRLNPGLLYMATTAMNEPLFLAEMIWAVLLLVEFQRSPNHKLLLQAGLVLVCAIFTRYERMGIRAVAWLFATWPGAHSIPPCGWREPVCRLGAGVCYRHAVPLLHCGWQTTRSNLEIH